MVLNLQMYPTNLLRKRLTPIVAPTYSHYKFTIIVLCATLSTFARQPKLKMFGSKGKRCFLPAVVVALTLSSALASSDSVNVEERIQRTPPQNKVRGRNLHSKKEVRGRNLSSKKGKAKELKKGTRNADRRFNNRFQRFGNNNRDPEIPTFEETEADIIPRDLGYRFSKTECDSSHVPDNMFPLTSEDFPLTIGGDVTHTLKHYCEAWSIMTVDDYELRNVNMDAVARELGERPSHPGEEHYWNELEEVIRVQISRRLGEPLSSITDAPLPDTWENFTPEDCADAVHNEFPGSHHQKLIERFVNEGVDHDYDVVPFRSKSDFVGHEVRMADLLTWAIGVTGPINFRTKWVHGRIRPEEMVWKILIGESTVQTGVPQRIVNTIFEHFTYMEKMEDFTAYPEGCPQHPSWPAMHSAASAASSWLPLIMDLTDEQYCQVLLLDYYVSYSRTIAGVHYESDNISGLQLGQQIVLNEAPAYLAQKYGGDINVIRAKADSLRFDWATFDPTTCA